MSNMEKLRKIRTLIGKYIIPVVSSFLMVGIIYVTINRLQKPVTINKKEAAESSTTPTTAIYKVFVTSTSYDGNLGGVSGADAKCMRRAQAAGLYETYKAWVSTTTSEPKNWIPDVKYVLRNSTVVANNKADLLDGTIQNKINIDEFGNTVSFGKNTYTGTYATGDGTHYTCNDWTSNLSSLYGDIGSVDSIDTWWSSKPTSRSQCHVRNRRLYCFQTSPNLPTPVLSPTITPIPTVTPNHSPTPTKTPTPGPTSVPYKVFVTSTLYAGNLGSAYEADNKCQLRAQAAGLSGYYKAWVSDSTIDAKYRIVDDVSDRVKFVLVDGITTVAENPTDLSDGTIQNAINKDEYGNSAVLTPVYVWTGTYATGDETSNNCSNWTTSDSSYNGDVGSLVDTSSWWSKASYSLYNCSGNYRLYCFQTAQ